MAGNIATSVAPMKNISSAKGLILMQSISYEIAIDYMKSKKTIS